VIAAEVLDELAQVGVRHARHMRRGQPGIDAAAAPAIEDRDAVAVALQEVRGRQPGNPGADDRDVDGHVAVEPRVPRHRRRILPVRLRLELCRFRHAATSSTCEMSKPPAIAGAAS